MGANAAGVFEGAPEVNQTSKQRPGCRGGLGTLPNELQCSLFVRKVPKSRPLGWTPWDLSIEKIFIYLFLLFI